MNKFIVTTTIYKPTEATLKYAEMNDWTFIVVGDLKTPHDEYRNLNLMYLSPPMQESTYPKLSDAIGWNCIMRRNIGFVHAYKLGADIIASIDDDNIPYSNWGKDIRVGTEQEVDIWDCNSTVAFDPMKLSDYPELWHRGYPINQLPFAGKLYYSGKQTKKILFQADLWDGDPDVDAICRFMYWPTDLKLGVKAPFTSDLFMPFNSQNTFIAREALPYYMVLPYVGRMDDIWGGYIAQHLLDTRPLFMPATVYQRRNEQSIQKNLEDEVHGYMYTEEFLSNIDTYVKYLPAKTNTAFLEYRKLYE